MWTFLKALILLPVAIVVVLLAVANRGPVVLSFDPLSTTSPELSIAMPLFALLFAAVLLGIVIGGVGAWFAQSDNRRARRQSSREVRHLRAEVERARHAAPVATGSNLPAVAGRRY